MMGLTQSANTEVSGEFLAHFINVEQGDSALIQVDGKNILVDSGEYSAFSKLYSYLNSLEIEKLDMIIVSHPHSDHIGCLGRIISEFGVDTIVMADMTEEMTPVTTSYEKMIEAADKCSAEFVLVNGGDNITVSEDCTIDFLAPIKEYEDYNNYSIVCRFNYGDTSFLFTGDIEKTAERDIVDSGEYLSADVIKIAHHGSSTSSLKVFLMDVNPRYAVISAGAENDYGHPHRETLKLLELLEIETVRTDINGDIIFVSDGENISVVKEKE